MTEWADLRHAYGSAKDLPVLLERIATEPSDQLWNDLWSALCHQGDVYPASFAALPWLAEVAGGEDRGQVEHALLLAGAILTGQSYRPPDVRTTYSAEIATFLNLTNRQLRACSDNVSYIYLLGALLAFEGSLDWSDELTAGLANGEFEVTCPGCEADLYVVLGDPGSFSTAGDYVGNAAVAKSPLLPTDPGHLQGIAHRLHDLATSDGQPALANSLTYVFGNATCPTCSTNFPITENLA